MAYNMVTKESKIIITERVHQVSNFIDDWIYYITNGDGLYRIKTDGTSKIKLLDKIYITLMLIVAGYTT